MKSPAARWSVRAKIVVIAVATSGAVAVLLAATALVLEYGTRYQALREAVTAAADVTAINAAAAVAFGDEDAARETLGSLRAYPEVTDAWLLDANGKRFASYAAKGAQRDATPLKVSAEVRIGQERVGRIVIDATGAPARAAVRAEAGAMLAFLAAALGLSLLLAARLQRWITQPVQALVRVVGEVAARRDYTVRAQVLSDDEFGALASGMNTMLAALQSHGAESDRLVAQLEDARDHAQAASEAKSRFLATMSHEIRTPMNGVLGMNEMLLNTQLTPRQRECATTVQQSGQHLLNVINDILDFSKIEVGRLELEAVDFDFAEVLEQSVAMFAEPAAKKGIELIARVVPVADGPVAVRGDPFRLRQVYANLIGNAVKFTATGEVVAQVTVLAREEDRLMVECSVRDTGVGIPREAQATIFEHFSQADGTTTRRYGGTGLGLAICQRIVSLMGGSLAVDSRPGAGAHFHFRLSLPLASAVPVPDAAALAGRHVLVVDDNATNREVLAEQLRSWGVHVWLASGAGEALALLAAMDDKGAACDAALLDMHMPDKDGLALAAELRAMPRYRELPLVLASSVAMSALPMSGGSAVVDRVLTKPLRKQDLCDVLAGLVSRSMAPRPEPVQASLRRLAGHVLVVEDIPVNLAVAKAMLAQLGVTCHEAYDGAMALDQAANHAYDLVLMDAQMPVMDGYEATRRLRECFGARLPIVALTANAGLAEEHLCRDAGMDDFLAKPYSLAQLHTVLARFLPAAADAAANVPVTAAGGGEEPAELISEKVLADLRGLDPGNGEALVRRVAGMFLSAEPDLSRRIEQSLAGNDRAALRTAAHALKSSAANIGALSLSRVCARLEDAARNDVDLVRAGLRAAFAAERDRAVTALRQLCGRAA